MATQAARRAGWLLALALVGQGLCAEPGVEQEVALSADVEGDIQESEVFAEPEKRWGIAPFPVIAYSPETSAMFGAVAFLWVPTVSDSPDPRMNTLTCIGIYTLRNQASIGISGDWYFREGRLKLSGGLEGSRFPDSYFGIGPETSAAMEEQYTPVTLKLEGSVGWELSPGLYLGPGFHVSYHEIHDVEPGGMLDQDGVAGSTGAVVYGAGALLTLDTRDNQMYPRRGSLLAAKSGVFLDSSGGDKWFTQVDLDARKYLPLWNRHVLAFQSRLVWSGEDVPFQAMPELGGSELLRGFYEGRFRDRVAAAAQVEYRFPLFWRLGGVLFGGVGLVSPSLEAVSLRDGKPAGGAGLRIALPAKEQRINFRLDVGFSEDGAAVYFAAMEAF
jgi:outer membrane protein assembly factor BamA